MQTKPVLRRRHSAEVRSAVLAACQEPGASVAAVAIAHGLNANLVHKWRRKQAGGAVPQGATMVGEFVALPLPAAPLPLPSPLPAAVPPTPADIRIELHRGATTITVAWPMAGASECGEWLRQWLK